MYVEKEPQSPHPLAPANGYGRSNDTEAAGAAHDAREQRKKKRTKCFIYIVLFVIFQTGVITLFSLTVMKVKTPKFRIREVQLLSTGSDNPPAAPRLQMNLNAEFSVKNTNFGRYKYRNTTVEFFYAGTKIGDVAVPNSRAGWRSTKKVKLPISLDINNNPQLAGDLSAGVVKITSSAQMRGRVELMFIMKKNKATNMNCTMDINIATATQTITNIVCK